MIINQWIHGQELKRIREREINKEKRDGGDIVALSKMTEEIVKVSISIN